jgi:hypothetical protein
VVSTRVGGADSPSLFPVVQTSGSGVLLNWNHDSMIIGRA